MRTESETKKEPPPPPIKSRKKKKKKKGFGQLTGNAYLGIFERLDNNEGGWRVSRTRKKFEWFARSLSPGMFHRPQVMAEGELPPGGIGDGTTTGIAE